MNKLCQLLNISEQQYYSFLFDAACEYAEWYLGADALQFIQSAAYWIWYSNAFEQADAYFFEQNKNSAISKEQLLVLWKQIHEPETTKVFPSNALLSITIKQKV